MAINKQNISNCFHTNPIYTTPSIGSNVINNYDQYDYMKEKLIGEKATNITTKILKAIDDLAKKAKTIPKKDFIDQYIRPMLALKLDLSRFNKICPVKTEMFCDSNSITPMIEAGIKSKEMILKEVENELDTQIAEQVASNMATMATLDANNINATGSSSYYNSYPTIMDNLYTSGGQSLQLVTSTTTSAVNPVWYTNVVQIVREQLNRIDVQEGHPAEIKLPDGTLLNVDEKGNFTINDSEAKIIYKSDRMKEGNKFINATDLIESFIKALGEKGVKQTDVLSIPIELFFTWLVAEAAKQDAEEVPEMDVVEQLKKYHIPLLAAPVKEQIQLDMFPKLNIIGRLENLGIEA